MSISTFGIVISKNYKDNLDELQKELGWKLKKEGIIDLETASENRKEAGIVDIYFSKKGTLLFLSAESMDSIDGKCIKGIAQLAFAIEEITMAFILQYYENGILKRSIMDFDGELIETGTPFSFEEKCEETAEVIYELIEEMIDFDLLMAVELEGEAVRYIQA
ncbi:MAG: hypothetical protein ACPGXZ_07080 [Saprospiraceae bacterium]